MFRRRLATLQQSRGACPFQSELLNGSLNRERSRDVPDPAARVPKESIQRDAGSAKRTLEALTEAGLVEAHGATRARSYTLSAGLYQATGDKAAYTRQLGFAPLQQEQLVLGYVRQRGQSKRAEVMELCRLSEGQAKELLKRLKASGVLVLHGKGPASVYRLAE